MAKLAENLITDYRDMRIIVVTHVKELIEQSYLELVGIWPFAPAGIYSAGLGRREAQSQILFCGIQTVHGRAAKIGYTDLVMIDEAHLTPRNADTMYGRFLGDLAAINSDMRVCGFTATPYRTDSGRLDEGEVRLFDEIVYTYGIADGIKDGYLAPLISKGMETGFDLEGVGRRGGDFIPGALQAAVDKSETTRAAVDEICEAGKDRKSWLAFCAGVEHAHHVRDEIRAHGIRAETITGETSSGDRAKWIDEFKSGAIRCLTNNSVLTTGFNAPGVDLIAGLRPTESAGLYVQIAGRGTRLAPGKTNCLYLDFAKNVWRHGPVDAVTPKKPGDGKGVAPVKECTNCHSLVHISAKVCPDCGHPFPIKDEPKHTARAAVLPILSTDNAPRWLDVHSRVFHRHEKPGGTPSVRAEFFCGYTVYKNWVCPQHAGFAKTKSDKFWKDHGGQQPPPADVAEFLKRQGELKGTTQIQVRISGRYPEVLSMRAGNDNVPPPSKAAAMSGHKMHIIDDEIPF